MFYYRKATPCADLVRTPRELAAFGAIRPCDRQHRYQLHTDHTADSYIDSTVRFIHWKGVNAADLPWSAEDVLAFLQQRRDHEGDGIPKVLAHLPAIAAYHTANGFPPPRSPELAAYCSYLRSQHERQPATPALLSPFLAMLSAAGAQQDPLRARDVALLLVGYAHGFRPSELSAMRWLHLEWRPGAVVVTLPLTKKNRRTFEPEVLEVGAAWNPQLCPLLALTAWRERNPSKFVFPYIDRFGRMQRALSSSEIIKIIKFYGREAGLRGKITAYSLRRGAGRQLRVAGASKEEVREFYRHERAETTDLYLGRTLPRHNFTHGVLEP